MLHKKCKVIRSNYTLITITVISSEHKIQIPINNDQGRSEYKKNYIRKNHGMGKFKEHLFEMRFHSMFYVGISLLSQMYYVQS